MSGAREFLTGTTKSTPTLKRATLPRFLDLAVPALSLVLFLAMYSSARFWWQIPIAASSPVWMPILIAMVLLQCVRCRRGAMSVFATLVTVSTAIGACYRVAAPVVSLMADDVQKRQSVSAPISFLIVDHSVGRQIPDLKSDVLVLRGATFSEAQSSLFPYRKNFFGEDVAIAIASRFPFSKESIDDFGDAVLPEGALKLELPDGQAAWVGLMQLRDGLHKEAFDLNRVTLRRIGTFYRNLREPGILIVDLKSPVFTKYYGLLTRYGHLRNAWKQVTSISKLWEVASAGRHVLVNPEILVHEVSSAASDGRFMGYTLVRLSVAKSQQLNCGY